MSADNYIGVRPTKDGKFQVEGGSASCEGEDCQYAGHIYSIHDDRVSALVAAHDQVGREFIVEYGVWEMEPKPDKPCGRCYVCVHDRNIVAVDITRCDGCHEPISEGEWQSLTSEGTFHSRCEPKRRNYDASTA